MREDAPRAPLPGDQGRQARATTDRWSPRAARTEASSCAGRSASTAGNGPVDRRSVQDCRRDLQHHSANCALLIATGDLRSDARSRRSTARRCTSGPGRVWRRSSSSHTAASASSRSSCSSWIALLRGRCPRRRGVAPSPEERHREREEREERTERPEPSEPAEPSAPRPPARTRSRAARTRATRRVRRRPGRRRRRRRPRARRARPRCERAPSPPPPSAGSPGSRPRGTPRERRAARPAPRRPPPRGPPGARKAGDPRPSVRNRHRLPPRHRRVAGSPRPPSGADPPGQRTAQPRPGSACYTPDCAEDRVPGCRAGAACRVQAAAAPGRAGGGGCRLARRGAGPGAHPVAAAVGAVDPSRAGPWLQAARPDEPRGRGRGAPHPGGGRRPGADQRLRAAGTEEVTASLGIRRSSDDGVERIALQATRSQPVEGEALEGRQEAARRALDQVMDRLVKEARVQLDARKRRRCPAGQGSPRPGSAGA